MTRTMIVRMIYPQTLLHQPKDRALTKKVYRIDYIAFWIMTQRHGVNPMPCNEAWLVQLNQLYPPTNLELSSHVIRSHFLAQRTTRFQVRGLRRLAQLQFCIRPSFYCLVYFLMKWLSKLIVMVHVKVCSAFLSRFSTNLWKISSCKVKQMLGFSLLFDIIISVWVWDFLFNVTEYWHWMPAVPPELH